MISKCEMVVGPHLGASSVQIVLPKAMARDTGNSFRASKEALRADLIFAVSVPLSAFNFIAWRYRAPSAKIPVCGVLMSGSSIKAPIVK
jgi:hypothetical protein